jgi:tRNA U38,U39,U40 pseudouridine synthase TruA
MSSSLPKRIDSWFLLSFFGGAYHGSQSQGGSSSVFISIEDVLNSAFKAFVSTFLSSTTTSSSFISTSSDEVLKDLNYWTFTTASRLDAHVNAKEFLVRVNFSLQLLHSTLKTNNSQLENMTDFNYSTGAAYLRDCLNAYLPEDVHIEKIRLCRPSQIQLRRLELTKQYSYYIRTGGWRETATKEILSSTIYEKKQIELDRIVEAFKGVGQGVSHNFTPFAAARREKAGEARKGDKDSVRAIDRIIVAVLKPSECHFNLHEPCPKERAGQIVFDDTILQHSISTKEGIIPETLSLSSSSFLLPSPSIRILNETIEKVSQSQTLEKVQESSTSAIESRKRRKLNGSSLEIADNKNSFIPNDDPCILRFVFIGKGFLRHMIRRLAGAALMIGKGMLKESYIRDTLFAADQRLAVSPDNEASALITGAATDYQVLHGRGLWLEKMNVPLGFWDNENWCNNTRTYCIQYGLTYIKTKKEQDKDEDQEEDQEGIDDFIE